MKDIQTIHKKLEKQCPPEFQINEIIRFAYPYRELKIKATVNKSPEQSLQQIYTSFLKTIKAGYANEADLIQFLGLGNDDFLIKELYFLREKGFVDLVSDTWTVTEQGEAYIQDNSILQVLEEEDFWFLVDGLTDKVLPFRKLFYQKDTEKKFEFEIKYENRSPKILENKNEQLADLYKSLNQQKAYLIDYDKENILFDKAKWQDYYLIEYKPIKAKQDTTDAYIEVRNIDEDFSKEKELSKTLSDRYEEVIYGFSNSERTSFAKIKEQKELVQTFKKTNKVNTPREKNIEELSIWQTKFKFEEALKTAKKRILIESPWIKRATLQYIPLMEEALNRNVEIFILYGIEGNDEHHRKAEREVERLEREYNNFYLFHLPTHFEDLGNTKLTGTHRKLLIKDNDYYILGSFNFLSFNRKEGQTIANEESTLIRQNVDEKWKRVFEEYQL